MTMQHTDSGTRQGIDLQAYYAAHSGDIMLMLVIATLITIGHWRNWFYDEGHTNAGSINIRRVIGDFLFIPTLIVLGLLVGGFGLSVAVAAAVVAFFAFVGSAFMMTTFEKARDGALGVFLQWLTNLLPGGGKK